MVIITVVSSLLHARKVPELGVWEYAINKRATINDAADACAECASACDNINDFHFIGSIKVNSLIFSGLKAQNTTGPHWAVAGRQSSIQYTLYV